MFLDGRFASRRSEPARRFPPVGEGTAPAPEVALTVLDDHAERADIGGAEARMSTRAPYFDLACKLSFVDTARPSLRHRTQALQVCSA